MVEIQAFGLWLLGFHIIVNRSGLATTVRSFGKEAFFKNKNISLLL